MLFQDISDVQSEYRKLNEDVQQTDLNTIPNEVHYIGLYVYLIYKTNLYRDSFKKTAGTKDITLQLTSDF